MASNELIETLNAIKLDKDTNLLPENIKSGVTVLGVDGTLESNSGVKLFETVEDMQADANPQEGDLAVVYREDIQNMTGDTQTQYITFPETVILPETVTARYNCRLRAIDDNAFFDGDIQLSSTSFRFNGYSEVGMIRVQYTSTDGVNYTRTNFQGDSGDLTNPVDLGTSVGVYMSEEWNDNLGYFMLIGGMTFDGLYKYGNYPLEDTYCNSYNTNTELNSIPYLSPSISRPNEVEYDYNIIIVTDSHLDASGLYKVIDKCKVLWYGGGYGKDAVYNGKQGILVILYEPSYAESSSSNLNLVLEEYDFTISTNPTSKQIIRNWDDISIFPSPIYVAQLRSSSSEPYNHKWYFTSYENADYTGNGHAVSYKHTIYSVPSDITLPISSAGYGGKPEGITTKDGAYYYTNVYTNRYEPAPTQYTLTSSNQLLPGISAYGKTGNIVGNNSIYNNLDISVVLNNIGMPVIYNSAKGLGYDELNKVNTIYSAIEDVTTDRIYYPVISTGIIDTELEDNLQSTLNSTHINTINKTLLPLNNGNYFGVCDATVNNAPSLYGYVINTNGDVQSTYVLNIEDPASRNVFSGLVDVDYYYIFIGDYDVNELGLYKVDRNNGNIVNNTKKSLSYGISAGAAGIAKIDGVMREYYSSFFTIVGNNIVFITQTDTNYEYIGNILVINKDFEDVQTTSYSDISEYSPLPLTLDGYVFWLTQKVGTSTWLLNKYNIAENVVTNIEVGTSTQNWPSIGNIMTDGTYIYVSNDAGTFKISSNLEILETNVDDKNVFLVGDDFINVVGFTDYKNYRAEHMMQSLLIVNGELQESTNSINLWNGTNDEAPILINSRTLNTFMRCYYGGTNIVEYEKFKTVKYEEGIVHPSVGKIIFTGAEDRLTADGWNIIDINEQDYTNTISPTEYNTAVNTTEQILGNE